MIMQRRRVSRWRCLGLSSSPEFTIEILQLQYTDKVIDVPVVPVQFPSAGVEKTAELPHCSRRALDKVVDMPVCATTSARGAVQQGCGSPCDHAGGSAQDSVHRRNWWTFQLATERQALGFQQWRFMAAVKVFFAFFSHFSRSSGLSRS